MSASAQSLQKQLQTVTEERDQWAEKYQQSAQAYTQLLAQVKALLRDRFGRRSERFEDADDPQQWLFDVAELVGTGTTDSDADADNVIDIEPHRRKRQRRVKFPESLPREVTVITVEDEARKCSCGSDKVLINHAVHERLHYIPPVFEVQVEKREVLACPKGCAGEMVRAPRPVHVLPKAKMSEALLAHLIVGKLDDRQPLYHLEKQLAHRSGGALSRQSMARAVIACREPLQPLVNLLKDEIIGYDIGAFDATGLQVLNEPGRSPSTSSSAYCIRGGPPGRESIIYAYNAREHKRFVDDWFEGFAGTLHCDADPLFARLFARPEVRPSFCHAHARRKFEPVARAASGNGLARTALAFYRRLYGLERHARENDMNAEQRTELRQRHAKPIIDEFHHWLERHAPTVLPKSNLGKAFRYLHSRWPHFCHYLEDGRLEIDNNLTEQQVKPFVIARKNFLFCQSVAGAHALCAHFSLVRTAKAHGLEPYRYYEYILRAVPHCRSVTDYEALLPWNVPFLTTDAKAA